MVFFLCVQPLYIPIIAASSQQGGVGKTTIAAALVHDHDIRTSFDKIVWVSVGQEPDIRELQSSIHFQLTSAHFPDSVKREDEAVKALRDAAKDCNLLLVLDDMWDPKHEKPLNCIDVDNASSRLLVTTRIRGLIKNSAEVDVGVPPSSSSPSADPDVSDSLLSSSSAAVPLAAPLWRTAGPWAGR